MRVLNTEEIFYIAGGDYGDGRDGGGWDGYANDNASNNASGNYGEDTNYAGLFGTLAKEGAKGVWGNAIYEGIKWGVEGLMNPPPASINNDINWGISPFFSSPA